jgi:hypothetical protein
MPSPGISFGTAMCGRQVARSQFFDPCLNNGLLLGCEFQLRMSVREKGVNVSFRSEEKKEIGTEDWKSNGS